MPEPSAHRLLGGQNRTTRREIGRSERLLASSTDERQRSSTKQREADRQKTEDAETQQIGAGQSEGWPS